MNDKIGYTFTASMWQHDGPGGWYFISLPQNISKEIRSHFQWQEEGWGRMKAMACIGNIEWDTSIWFDTKSKTHLLPVRAEIRKKGQLELDQTVEVSIWV